MKIINQSYIQQNLILPSKNSHKGGNGKLMIIGGSKLFHGASLFALKTASRIVDMVYYSSVVENQELTKYLKSNLYSFICVPQGKESEYIEEADVVLIGPGMVRGDKEYTGTGETGEQTKQLVLKYLHQFPHKQWIVDAGALQAITFADLKPLKNPIITPHIGEFEKLFSKEEKRTPINPRFQETQKNNSNLGSLGTIENLGSSQIDKVQEYAKAYDLIIVLKGPTDIICSPTQCLLNKTGNEGMTKGGTGDVLASLIGSLATTHDPFTAAAIGTFINGQAGDNLYKTVGPYFNADQLADQVPKVLWEKTKDGGS